jgi:hypothetical protein
MLSVDNPYGLLGRIVRAEVSNPSEIIWTGRAPASLRKIEARLDEVERMLFDAERETYVSSMDTVGRFGDNMERLGTWNPNLAVTNSSGGNGGEIDPNNQPGTEKKKLQEEADKYEYQFRTLLAASDKETDENKRSELIQEARSYRKKALKSFRAANADEGKDDTANHPIDCTCIFCIPGA